MMVAEFGLPRKGTPSDMNQILTFKRLHPMQPKYIFFALGSRNTVVYTKKSTFKLVMLNNEFSCYK